jgi:signal transduction histidine kinase
MQPDEVTDRRKKTVSWVPRILIVDDDEAVCNSLKEFLSDHYSDITLAFSGADAVSLLAKEKFDLILLDLLMPGVSGGEVMDFVKREKLDVGVIVITGHSSTESAVAALRKGAHDYLQKPFSLEDLLSTVGAALRVRRLEDERRRFERELQLAHAELERRVQERTAELARANERLRLEVQMRTDAEKALRKAHDELEVRVEERTVALGATNRELQNEIAERKRMDEALRTSSEKLKLFAYSVIHDLKSPAVGIYGLTKLIHQRYRETLDEDGQRICEQILKAAEHIAALVEKINVYIAAKEGHLTIERLSPKEILQLVREEFSSRLSLRGVKWTEPATMPEIRADRLSVVRAYRNLVENALKHGGEDLSEIAMGYEESQAFHVLSVSDNGVGMKGGDLERFFSPYSRDGASHLVEGAGLGLAIIREIAERHGGKVWAESLPARGITFRLSLAKRL